MHLVKERRKEPLTPKVLGGLGAISNSLKIKFGQTENHESTLITVDLMRKLTLLWDQSLLMLGREQEDIFIHNKNFLKPLRFPTKIFNHPLYAAILVGSSLNQI